MKRKISIFFSVIAMLLTVVLTSSICGAKEDLPCILLRSGYAAENSVTTVTASLDTNLNLAAYSITLNFDPSMLEFIDASCNIKKGKFFSGDKTDDQVILIWSDSKNAALSGDIFTAKFKTKGDTAGKTIPVEIGYSVLANGASEEIPFKIQNCEIEVLDDYTWGDADCDKSVSVSDAVLINQYIDNPAGFSFTERQSINSDTDNNGIINMADLKNVLNYIIHA